ncbi:hypothetical protein SSS_05277 [Sarcoptes scabiei]|uniref:Uncharacterized protein n=1 Tax=Sarcoptes scabiei TaxID=52283 RepID=A0A834V9B5_SARSC|nr:hypothetical protein SSS_05277 [Sarcoptes scabiei]
MNSQTLLLLRNLLFILIGLSVVINATLELIFAPQLLMKYYLPAIRDQHHHNHNDLNHRMILIRFFYFVIILIQILNIIASFLLFVAIFLSNFHDRYIAYDTVMILSLSFSLSLILHRWQTNTNIYSDVIEKDIYILASRLGDWICFGNNFRWSSTTFNRNEYTLKYRCRRSDVFNWHQIHQCCGWTSSNDLIGIIEIDRINPWNLSRLPEFCCANHQINDFDDQKSDSIRCHSVALNLFNKTCHDSRESFLAFRGVSLISHPVHIEYIVWKLISVFLYTFSKRHVLPQPEGSYSFYITP